MILAHRGRERGGGSERRGETRRKRRRERGRGRRRERGEGGNKGETEREREGVGWARETEEGKEREREMQRQGEIALFTRESNFLARSLTSVNNSTWILKTARMAEVSGSWVKSGTDTKAIIVRQLLHIVRWLIYYHLLTFGVIQTIRSL